MSEEITITKDETISTINSEEPVSIPETFSPFHTETPPEEMIQTQAAPEPIPQPQPAPEPAPQPRAVSEPEPDIFENEFPDEPAEETTKKRRFFRSRSSEESFSRDQWILSRIDDAHMMEYLTLEQKRFEQIQTAKEKRERRIFTAFRLTVSLAAIVAVVYLLKDNPTILVNILYIAGILAAIWFLKNPKNKDEHNSRTDQ